MASSMLHYLIALKITDSIEIDNIDNFMIGALLPDASSHQDGSYSIAHFVDFKLDQGIKGFNWNNFKQKYEQYLISDSIYLGYFCHLIMDAVWFKNMADKYIRIHPKKERNIYYQKGYEDFHKLNSILVNKYNLSCPSFEIPKINIDEINFDYIDIIFENLAHNFCDIHPYDVSELSIYPFEEIEKYITDTINVCLAEISSLNSKQGLVDPVMYYTQLRDQ